jgi:CheY-like chemotaxis protein
MMPTFDHTHALKILLAEDHLVNQKLALLMLERLGYRADVAVDGLEVLEALQRQLYDVVLLDVQMPKMDGLEVARQIHQRWQHPTCPYLIVITANAMRSDRKRCLDAGIDYYMTKPICMQELAQVLSQRNPLKPLIAPLDTDANVDSERHFSRTPAESDRAALDLTVLASFRQEMGDTGHEVVIELIGYYVAEAPQLLQTIETAISQHDREAAQGAAHGLKASSASLGALYLNQLCQELETIALSASIDQLTDVFARMRFEYKRVETALKHEQSSSLP